MGRRAIVALAVTAAILAGCGDDGEPPAPTTVPTTSAAVDASTSAPAPSTTGVTPSTAAPPLDPGAADYPTVPPRPTLTYPAAG